MVARHEAAKLLDALLAWRKDAIAHAGRAASELAALRKQVLASGQAVGWAGVVLLTALGV